MIEKIKKHLVFIILLLIVIAIVIGIIIYINYLNNLPEKTTGTEIDRTIEEFDTSFTTITNTSNALSVYDVLEIVNEYLSLTNENDNNEKLYSILDEVYLDYYDITEKNVFNKLEDYLGNYFIINDMQIAQISGSYSVYLIDCIANDENYEIILKLYPANENFSVIFSNYIEEYGLDNYVENNLTSEDETIQDTEYNKYEFKSYTGESIVKKYSEILRSYGFDYVYENYIGEETKDNYSKEELESFYDNEDFFFQRAVVVDLETAANEDYTLYTYEFKDRKTNEFIISQKDAWHFTIDLVIAEEEEITNPDGGGLLDIIEQ